MKKMLALACISCALQASVEIEQPVLSEQADKKELAYPNLQERKAILAESLAQEVAASGVVVKCSVRSWAKNTYCFNQKTLEEMVKRAHKHALERATKSKRSQVVTLTNKDMKKAFKQVMKDYNISASRSSLTRAEKAALGVTGTVVGFVVLSTVMTGVAFVSWILCGGHGGWL